MTNETQSLLARLNAKAEKAATSRRRETAELMGEEVEIRSLMVGEKHRLIDEAFVRKGKDLEPVLSKLIPSLLHKTVYDPASGTAVFASPAAVSAFVEQLPEDSAAADELQALMDRAMDVSGLNKEAKRVAAKNSEASAG